MHIHFWWGAVVPSVLHSVMSFTGLTLIEVRR